MGRASKFLAIEVGIAGCCGRAPDQDDTPDGLLARKGTGMPGCKIAYARRQGSASVRRQLWPLPAVSSANKMSPGRMRKCSPWRVLKSSVPLSVMTNCLAGAVCQAKAPPEDVS